MTEYHCYYLGTGDRLRKMAVIEAVDDAHAVIEAERIRVATNQDAMEIWRSIHLIGRTSLS